MGVRHCTTVHCPKGGLRAFGQAVGVPNGNGAQTFRKSIGQAARQHLKGCSSPFLRVEGGQ